jgi:HSP20 family protein
MANLIRNQRKNLPRLFWNSPLDRFFGNDRMDLWGDEMLQTVPSVNVKETDQYYSIEVAAPGLKKEDFNVDVEGNFLTISCEKETRDEKETKDRFSRKEYSYTSFSRSFTLPDNADSEHISAKYEDGLLRLTINKKPEAKNRNGHKITVE